MSALQLANRSSPQMIAPAAAATATSHAGSNAKQSMSSFAAPAHPHETKVSLHAYGSNSNATTFQSPYPQRTPQEMAKYEANEALFHELFRLYASVGEEDDAAPEPAPDAAANWRQHDGAELKHHHLHSYDHREQHPSAPEQHQQHHQHNRRSIAGTNSAPQPSYVSRRQSMTDMDARALHHNFQRVQTAAGGGGGTGRPSLLPSDYNASLTLARTPVRSREREREVLVKRRRTPSPSRRSSSQFHQSHAL